MTLGLFEAPKPAAAPPPTLTSIAAGVPPQPWAGRVPRPWQSDCLPRLLDAFSTITDQELDDGGTGPLPKGHAGVVYACTGSGKSVELCEFVAHRVVKLRPKQVYLVTVPTIALVEQLLVDLRRRLTRLVTNDGRPVTIGACYTDAWEWHRTVVITCLPSLPKLIEELRNHGLSVVEWVADECHRTDAARVTQAHRDMTDAWGTVPRIGFSATPYLSDRDRGLKLWRHLLYQYTPDDAIRDEALVPWNRHGLTPAQQDRYEAVRAKVANFDAEERELDAVIDEACTEWVVERATSGGVGVVSASSIVDAEAFARDLSDALAKAGRPPAYAVHSKQSASIVAHRRDALKAGRASCLVHVNMLSEGVDMPFLGWLALRRTRARVAFVQEVGRGLRAFTGKKHADIWDPFDMFSAHGLTHPAALADLPPRDNDDAERDAEGRPIEMMELVDPLTGKTYRVPADPRLQNAEQQIAVAHSTGAAYLADVANCLRANKLLGERKFAPGRWRADPASEPQLATMIGAAKSMKAITQAGPHGRAIAAAYRMIMAEHDEAVTAGRKSPIRKGAVSDFLDVRAGVKVTYDEATGTWDKRQQVAAFAALDGMVDPETMIAAAETVVAAKRRVTR